MPVNLGDASMKDGFCYVLVMGMKVDGNVCLSCVVDGGDIGSEAKERLIYMRQVYGS
jgi:hypothetical protein